MPEHVEDPECFEFALTAVVHEVDGLAQTAVPRHIGALGERVLQMTSRDEAAPRDVEQKWASLGERSGPENPLA